MSIYEIIMLICFGLAWPLSIYKMLKSKTAMGKSAPFLVAVIIGYLCGIMHKFNNSYDNVIYLYALNAVMVSLDLFLVLKYGRKAKFEAAKV